MNRKLTEQSGDYNEGTDWDERYRRGDSPWDHGFPVPAVREALEFFGSPRKILVPGCGFGHDAAALARGGHLVEGWDISPTALEKAMQLYPIDSLRFLHRDFLRDPIEPGSFEGIFEHTFLCAIGPDHWPAAVERFADLLSPGGLVFAVLFTNLEQENPPPWGINEVQARSLFSSRFEILGVQPPVEVFARRVGEETVWRMRRR